MNSDTRRYLERFEVLATRYARTLNICEEIVLRHGVARNIRDGADGKHSFHDYVFLCFTKATKTLGSIYMVASEFRGEDALILTRSAYEAYVQIAFLLKNPTAVNDLVSTKLRAIRGEVVADNKRRRFLDVATQQEVGQIHSIGKMAWNSPWPADGPIHQFLYAYLCSYSHMDIQSLPYFLEGDRFTTRNKDRLHQAGLYSAYCATLLLDVMGLLRLHSSRTRTRVHRSILETRRVLQGIFSEMAEEKSNGELPLRFLHRLESVGQAWGPDATRRGRIQPSKSAAYKILVQFARAERPPSVSAFLAIPELQAFAGSEIDDALRQLEEEGFPEPNMEVVRLLANGAVCRRLIGSGNRIGFVDACGVTFTVTEQLVGKSLKLSADAGPKIADAYRRRYRSRGSDIVVAVSPTLLGKDDLINLPISWIPRAFECVCSARDEIIWPYIESRAGAVGSMVALPIFVRGLVTGRGIKGMQKAVAQFNQMHSHKNVQPADIAFSGDLVRIFRQMNLPITQPGYCCVPLSACRQMAKIHG